jgi:AraC-like DNA-binding protein
VDHAFPQWKGFERAPEGHLLDQVVDLSGPMGVAYERSIGFHKDFHAHDRPMIVLPRGSSVVRVRTAGGQRATHTIGSASAVIVPSRVAHEDEAVTFIFDTLALYPSSSLLDAVGVEEAIAKAKVATLFGRPREFRRSAWLDQLTQEYVFARVLSRRESAKTVAFLERQILVEIFACAMGRGRTRERPPSLPSPDTVAGRAVRHIEANLFSELDLATIAARAFASPSTLLRHFRRDTGQSPHAYIKTRRLEEARRLIEAGRTPVGDVAMLVGYENFAAFSTAFKRHFGRPPSAFRGRSSATRASSPPR